MQTPRTKVISLLLVLICSSPASGGTPTRTHEVACAPTRPGLCAALTEDGAVFVTSELGGRWRDPTWLPSLDASQATEDAGYGNGESDEPLEPKIAICDSGLWIAVQADRAFIGDAEKRSWRDAAGLLPDPSHVGWMPPVCDDQNRLWIFAKDEVFVISSNTGQARISARFAISAAGAPVFDPHRHRVLVPTHSGVLWISSGDHSGRSGVAHTRPLAPIAVEPGTGRLLGVWSGRLWRFSEGSQPEDLGRVPGGLSSLVVDGEGLIWCLTDKGAWWRLQESGLTPTNAEAVTVDGSGRLLMLPDVRQSHLASVPLTTTPSARAPGPILDHIGPPPCAPRGGFRVFLGLWGNWRQNNRADLPADPSLFGSFLGGGASIGMSIGLEAAPHEPGACKKSLESWSRKQQKKILEQARLLEALRRNRFRDSQSPDPYEAALTRLESERIEHLLAVVERGTLAEEPPKPTGAQL